MICVLSIAIVSVLFLCNIINEVVYVLTVMLIPILAEITSLLYFKFGWFKFYYHDILDWHIVGDSDPIIAEDGDVHFICEHCGEDITPDDCAN